MTTRLGQWVRYGLILISIHMAGVGVAFAAPYAAMVIDARSGKVLLAENADTRLHPASLTKMMTLYIVFQAVKHGELTLDTEIVISKNAASEPPSKLGLRPGQRIKLRYLIRAAAVKSANDAATALGEAVSGSEAAFANRMNRTAKALGMTRTTFGNAHGLTKEGHLSTARDMTLLGRHLFFDHPEYYNLFSRRSADAGMRSVNNTNRRFLDAYRGADGIKTGYTNAAGFNLVASAVRGNERIIATVFGGRSTAQRNAKVAELLDFGFRQAPSGATIQVPDAPTYTPGERDTPPAGKSILVVRAVNISPFPTARPGEEIEGPTEDMLVAMAETIAEAVTASQIQTPVMPAPAARPDTLDVATATPADDTVAELEAEVEVAAAPPEPVLEPVAEEAAPSAPILAMASVAPLPRPGTVQVATPEPEAEAKPIIVTRLSTSGERYWGINVGRYPSHYQAERMLLKTALAELDTLDTALRKVANGNKGYEANFVGLTKEGADRACRRLQARDIACTTLGPS